MTDMAMATGEDATYSARDFIGMATSMLIAGNDTTANLLASAIYLFAKYPDQRARLVDDPSLMGKAVEEILRYEPPVHGLARVLTRDTELYETPLSEGDKVLLLYAAGNRDERVFDDPEAFDVGREITQHLSFGHGVHYCVGLHLGRLESRIALGTFLERIPDYDVALENPRATSRRQMSRSRSRHTAETPSFVVRAGGRCVRRGRCLSGGLVRAFSP